MKTIQKCTIDYAAYVAWCQRNGFNAVFWQNDVVQAKEPQAWDPPSWIPCVADGDPHRMGYVPIGCLEPYDGHR